MAALNTTLNLSGLRTQSGRPATPLVVLLAICFFARVAAAQFGGGTGEPDDPYLIYTAEQLNEIGADSQNLDKHFKLMSDVDLSDYSGTDFNIIGSSYSSRFSGVFDGSGRRIYNFTYTSTDTGYIGLFGCVRGENALIKNLGMIDANIDAGTGKRVGSLVGDLHGGIVRGCYVRGGSVSGEKYVGGLVGYSEESTITDSCATVDVSADKNVGGLTGWNEGFISSIRVVPCIVSNCYSTGSVSGRIDAGGLAGGNLDGTITNCYSTGSVSDPDGFHLGGLVGSNFRGTITNCYSTGNVSGLVNVGGLVGHNVMSGAIANCYSTGNVSARTNVGGLVGFNFDGAISTSFWDSQRSGLSNMCGGQWQGTGCDDGEGRTTAQMQTENAFLEAGWDLMSETANGTEDIWSVCEGLNYPELAWQFVSGDFDGDNIVDLADFAFFAERWLSSDHSFFWCRGADITGDGEVGFDDLREFADNWLTEGIPSSTAAVYLTVDDFESYNDLDPGDPESNRIFDVWADGYDNLAINGAMVGHAVPPYAEQSIVYGGEQSMPYYYNALFKLAKAELTLSPPQNWAEDGAEVLSLWFHGDRLNGVTPMSIILNGSSAVYHDNPDVTRTRTWMEWIINLQAFTGVDLASVNSIAICLGDPSNTQAGGTGKMFFDSIRLYGP